MSDWIEWRGWSCPVAEDTQVFVRLRDGFESVISRRADHYTWGHGSMYDVVEYKLAEPKNNKQMNITMEVTPEEEEAFKALDVQVGGGHYKDLKIQPIEYIHANKLGYCEANVVKYISRWRAKGGKKDLQKAKHYIDLLIQLEGM